MQEAPPATEARNPRTAHIDRLPATIDVLQLLHAEDAAVGPAVRAALPALAQAVDLAVARMRRGGALHYFGAGSSGIIGLLDAAEIAATFGVDPDRVKAHQAGGVARLGDPDQSAEDDRMQGRLAAAQLSPDDTAVALTASGRTPYVAGVLAQAAQAGALRILVTSNPAAPLAGGADVHICADTGPEAIAGSTRMKAGSAAKLICNLFSTALMVRLGATWSNLMIDVVPSNAKLRSRVVAILVEATGEPEERCAAALRDANGHARTALSALLETRR